MQNIATISKMTIGKRTESACEDFHLRESFARFRSFIQTADWDKGYILNEGIDKLCLYLLAAAFICFLATIALTPVK